MLRLEIGTAPGYPESRPDELHARSVNRMCSAYPFSREARKGRLAFSVNTLRKFSGRFVAGSPADTKRPQPKGATARPDQPEFARVRRVCRKSRLRERSRSLNGPCVRVCVRRRAAISPVLAVPPHTQATRLTKSGDGHVACGREGPRNRANAIRTDPGSGSRPDPRTRKGEWSRLYAHGLRRIGVDTDRKIIRTSD